MAPSPPLLLLLLLLVLILASNGASIEPSPPLPERSWEILTKRNFSSQIRAHPHILLLVVLPWSGESRSLRNDVMKLVSEENGKLDKLKLMVLDKDTEKMLADILGAKADLTLFYYHHSRRFHYQGRINARTIIESVSYIMSFGNMQLPLEPLNIKEQIKNFIESTDEAIFLLEFCGWSSRVMQNKDIGHSGSYNPMQEFSENGDLLEGNNTIDDETLQYDEKGKLKESGDRNLFCSYENQFNEIPWMEDFLQPTENVSLGAEVLHGKDGNERFDCSKEEFRQFETFFLNFTEVIRETFLPPKRLRFGHISDASLSSLVGIEKPKNWMLLRWNSGCPDCSEVLQEGEDLKRFVQMNSFVVDLDGDKSTHDYAFPANQPSIILFIDRWSESLKIRDQSKNALDIFRRFVLENQPFSKKMKGHLGGNTGISILETGQALSEKLTDDRHALADLLSGHNVLRISDQLTFMVVDKSGKVSVEKATAGHENTAYGVLSRFLQQKDSAIGKAAFSLIAKQAGFQLISDDFEIKIMDSVAQQREIDQFDSELKSSFVLPNAIASEVLPSSRKDHETAHDDSSSTEIGGIKQIENSIPQLDQEELSKVESTFKIADVSKNNHRFAEMGDDKQSNGQSGHSFCNEQDSFPVVDDSMKENFHKEDDNLNELSLQGVIQNSSESTDAATTQETQKENHILGFPFAGTCYVSDGGHRMLRVLTGDTKLPSVVILDPILDQHYVLSAVTNFDYSVLVSFVSSFLNGHLSPHKRSEKILSTSRQVPRPPFVNLDFHEADSIPRVTTESFSKVVLGCTSHFSVLCDTNSSNRDALVLFTYSWCGFCLRMELIVREVYRAFQGLASMLKNQRMNGAFQVREGNFEDKSSNLLPSVFFMDCSLNDCTIFLDSSLKKTAFPVMALYPSGKGAILYDGDISVNAIFEFISVYGGSSSNLMNKYKGILWTQRPKTSKAQERVNDASAIALPNVVGDRGNFHELQVEDLSRSKENLHYDGQLPGIQINQPIVIVGSILSATGKLANAIPFDNSSILIVKADQDTGFEGLILNKRLGWDMLPGLDKILGATPKEAPLSYGGPLKTLDMPLVSLTRKVVEGYTEVVDGLYYGGPVITRLSVMHIHSGKLSAADFWFFLGFSGWEWNQLFGEIARGDWKVSETSFQQFAWPEV